MQGPVTHFLEQSMLQTLPFFSEEHVYPEVPFFTFQLTFNFLIWAQIKVPIFFLDLF